MVFTRKLGDFHGRAVSFREGKGFPLANEGMTHSTLRILQCLLTAGAEKNQRMDEGLTPLHVAVLHGLLGMPCGV